MEMKKENFNELSDEEMENVAAAGEALASAGCVASPDIEKLTEDMDLLTAKLKGNMPEETCRGIVIGSVESCGNIQVL